MIVDPIIITEWLIGAFVFGFGLGWLIHRAISEIR